MVCIIKCFIYLHFFFLNNLFCNYCNSLYEASHYILRKKDLSIQISRQILFSFRLQMILFIEHDISFIKDIRDSEKRMIILSTQQLAYAVSKLSDDYNGIFTVKQLNFIRNLSEKIITICSKLHCPDTDKSSFLPILNLESNDEMDEFSTNISRNNDKDYKINHPFLDRLQRKDDVNGLAGAPIVLPKYIPIDYLLLPTRVNSLEDAVAAIRICDRLCTLISVQPHCVKNRDLQKLALIQYTVTQLVPLPRVPTAVDYSSCIWLTPMRYGLQLDLVIVFGRILEHFISSVFSIHSTKSLDAVKLIVSSCIACFIDVILRRESTDQSSEFCLQLMKGYGISLGDVSFIYSKIYFLFN